jgi:hypothetical protein
MVNTRATNQRDGAIASNAPVNQDRAGNPGNLPPIRRPIPGEPPTRSEIDRANPVIEQIPTQAQMFEEIRAMRAQLLRAEQELAQVRAEREANLH